MSCAKFCFFHIYVVFVIFKWKLLISMRGDCEQLHNTLFGASVSSLSVNAILHKCKPTGCNLFETWQSPGCLSCKPGNPASRPLHHRRSALLVLNCIQAARLSILSGTDVINRARRNKTNNLSADHWLSHTQPTGKQRVNMFQICGNDAAIVRVCVLVLCAAPSFQAAVYACVEAELFACLQTTNPLKFTTKKKCENVQVFTCTLTPSGDRTKGPSLPFKALLLHSPI